MPHYKAYESFQTKKSKDQKKRAKEKNKKIDENLFVSQADSFGVVLEVKYHYAFVLLNDEIIEAYLNKSYSLICNQVLFPGDKVILSKKNNDYIIEHILKRTSLISRVKKDGTKKSANGKAKNIAANIDLAVIVVATGEPFLHTKFIDRYLMILQNSNIPVLLCLNKSDLKTEREKEALAIYQKIGIPIIETSTVNNQGIEELKNYLFGKQAIFVGPSGVGKSSLTNKIMSTTEIKTGHVGLKTKRGRHTTTTSKYYIWNENSSIIDTPGIRSLDVSNFSPLEIQEYFPEFKEWKNACKYKDCLHYHEKEENCKIKEAVKNHLISQERYESYLKILKDVLNEKN